MKLQIKPLSDKIGDSIPLPYYATAGAAALDLHACIDEPAVLPAGGEALIPTGPRIGQRRARACPSRES